MKIFRGWIITLFFKQSTSENAQRTYARVMKFFLLACCFCFLGVVLFLDVWKYFMGKSHPEYWTGLKVVPILMLAKLFLGVYYNLSNGLSIFFILFSLIFILIKSLITSSKSCDSSTINTLDPLLSISLVLYIAYNI